jgi:hypothetical protein
MARRSRGEDAVAVSVASVRPEDYPLQDSNLCAEFGESDHPVRLKAISRFG